MLECSCVGVFNTILELNHTLDSQNSAELFYTWLWFTLVKGWDKICNRRRYGAKVGKKAGTSWMALPPVRLEPCHPPPTAAECVLCAHYCRARMCSQASEAKTFIRILSLPKVKLKNGTEAWGIQHSYDRVVPWRGQEPALLMVQELGCQILLS